VKARFQLSRTAELEWLLESGEKVAAKTLYHGTHRQLEELTPRDEHGDPRVKPAIFASPSRTFALAYTGKKWGDRDIEQSTGKGMTLREMRPGALQDIFGGQKGYLHHLSPDSFTALKGRRTAKEVVSYEAVAPKKIEVIPDALKALKRLPDVKLVAYDPTTPETHAAIKRQIRRMGEMTTQDARGYKRWWFEVAPPEMKKMFNAEERAARAEWFEKKAEEEHKLQGHTEVQGIPVAIENRKGSVRKGVDKDGHEWRTKMKAPYGYLEGTKGRDGEEVDAYVGPDKQAPNAYVVHQHKEDGTGYDEDKIMLGLRTKEEAKKLYLAHYDDPKFLGPISTVPVERLKELIGSGNRLDKISAARAMTHELERYRRDPRKVQQAVDWVRDRVRDV
jgi:hypothetical protein